MCCASNSKAARLGLWCLCCACDELSPPPARPRVVAPLPGLPPCPPPPPTPHPHPTPNPGAAIAWWPSPWTSGMHSSPTSTGTPHACGRLDACMPAFRRLRRRRRIPVVGRTHASAGAAAHGMQHACGPRMLPLPLRACARHGRLPQPAVVVTSPQDLSSALFGCKQADPCPHTHTLQALAQKVPTGFGILLHLNRMAILTCTEWHVMLPLVGTLCLAAGARRWTRRRRQAPLPRPQRRACTARSAACRGRGWGQAAPRTRS